MKTSVVLNTAADLIERDGWYSMYHGSDPHGAESPNCASNAIGKFEALEDFEAQYALSVHVAGECSVDAIWAWNDAPERTKREVIEALRAAALIESAREEQDAAWATYAELVTSA